MRKGVLSTCTTRPSGEIAYHYSYLQSGRAVQKGVPFKWYGSFKSSSGEIPDSSPVVFMLHDVRSKGARSVTGSEKAREEDDWDILCRKVVQGCFCYFFCLR